MNSNFVICIQAVINGFLALATIIMPIIQQKAMVKENKRKDKITNYNQTLLIFQELMDNFGKYSVQPNSENKTKFISSLAKSRTFLLYNDKLLKTIKLVLSDKPNEAIDEFWSVLSNISVFLSANQKEVGLKQQRKNR